MPITAAVAAAAAAATTGHGGGAAHGGAAGQGRTGRAGPAPAALPRHSLHRTHVANAILLYKNKRALDHEQRREEDARRHMGERNHALLMTTISTNVLSSLAPAQASSGGQECARSEDGAPAVCLPSQTGTGSDSPHARLTPRERRKERMRQLEVIRERMASFDRRMGRAPDGAAVASEAAMARTAAASVAAGAASSGPTTHSGARSVAGTSASGFSTKTGAAASSTASHTLPLIGQQRAAQMAQAISKQRKQQGAGGGASPLPPLPGIPGLGAKPRPARHSPPESVRLRPQHQQHQQHQQQRGFAAMAQRMQPVTVTKADIRDQIQKARELDEMRKQAKAAAAAELAAAASGAAGMPAMDAHDSATAAGGVALPPINHRMAHATIAEEDDEDDEMKSLGSMRDSERASSFAASQGRASFGQPRSLGDSLSESQQQRMSSSIGSATLDHSGQGGAGGKKRTLKNKTRAAISVVTAVAALGHYAQGPQRNEPRRISVVGSITHLGGGAGGGSADGGRAGSDDSAGRRPSVGEINESGKLMRSLTDGSRGSLNHVLSLTYLLKEQTLDMGRRHSGLAAVDIAAMEEAKARRGSFAKPAGSFRTNMPAIRSSVGSVEGDDSAASTADGTPRASVSSNRALLHRGAGSETAKVGSSAGSIHSGLEGGGSTDELLTSAVQATSTDDLHGHASVNSSSDAASSTHRKAGPAAQTGGHGHAKNGGTGQGNHGSHMNPLLHSLHQQHIMQVYGRGSVTAQSLLAQAEQHRSPRASVAPTISSPPPPPLPAADQKPQTKQQQQQQTGKHGVAPFLEINGLIQQANRAQTPMAFLHQRARYDGVHLPAVRLSAAERWRFAIRTVTKLLVNVKCMSLPVSRKVENAPGVNERSMSYALKEFQYQGDLIFSARIQQFLSTVRERSEDEIAMLNRLLMTRISSFAKFGYDQRIRFCKAMSYEAHRKGAVIIRQGHEPVYFYFVLSGQVEVLKERSDGFSGQLRLTLLNQGDCFGEVALDGNYQERRTTTVMCTAPSEFLRVDKDDYRRIVIGEDSMEDLEQRMQLLKQTPVFALADEQTLEQAVLKSQIRRCERNSVILREGESNKRLFFITTGTCRLDKGIPLFKKTVGKDQATLRPDRKDTQPMRKGEQRVLESVALAEIGPGESFPEPLPSGVSGNLSDRLDMISKINDHDALSMNRSYVTVVAVKPVVCVTMERIDFARIMSWGMFKVLLESSMIYSIPVEAMQDQWILQKGWEDYKRRIVGETMLNRPPRKK
ncbi:hypothetical protein HK105_206403 [Polyrhizophydium stewartii]|uniref:Cyclic nucleotide-binding domain-containing protein n=1 Tax=Polyrhizophydium stewartii TaxID=2732419 RepID=A0ABR4N3N0_9FUNG